MLAHNYRINQKPTTTPNTTQVVLSVNNLSPRIGHSNITSPQIAEITG